MAASTEVVVAYRDGLHARPATLLAKTAAAFSSTITIENLTQGSKPVNAKSPLTVLSIGIQRHDRLRIAAEGADEQEAVETIARLIASNFGEAEEDEQQEQVSNE
ncbi:MAG: HPr family phosphocarrier protein [Thermogemmatispora sp.]|uniref:HPr family phosphocarrier protein n=1 Tax=Thermogemmatispora sp. TaxID=1968838 RepID=UPI00262C5198|nr:HPr family phosphocarrier protein [Thermogemmatispora sp.]MBX5455740.1 HPr family phosphocarrier protein [Thermogemmatispora sp.]